MTVSGPLLSTALHRWRALHAGAIAVAAGCSCLAPSADAQTPSDAGAQASPRAALLPLLGEEAERRGYDLPLPFGLSINGMALNEVHFVQELRLGSGDSPPQTVSPKLLRVSPVDVTARSTTLRADVWLFPFLNLYGIGGYSFGTADLGLTVLPGAAGLTKELRIPTLSYRGITYGGGAVAAGGYKNVFLTVDANRTATRLDLLDSRVDTVVVGVRLGWRQRFDEVHGSWWLGGMYQRTSQTMSGSVSPSPDAPPLRFEVDQTTSQPWNLLIGTQWEIGREWWWLIEAGMGSRKQLLGSVNYRF